MDVINLSSNWKTLQAKLSTATRPNENSNVPLSIPHSKSLKRTLTEAIGHQPRLLVSKRQKASRSTSSAGSQLTKSRARPKMGGYLSTSASSGPNPSTQTDQKIGPADALQGAPKKLEIGQSRMLETAINVNNGHTNGKMGMANRAGKYVAIDCEMVGTHSLTPFSILAHNNRYQPSSAPVPPEYSILARVTVVSFSMETLYDAYVLPPKGVSICDYRTPFSGITARHLDPSNTTTRPIPFATAQREVSALLTGRILVGHALKHDLAVLGLSHPRRDIRDTARYPPYRARAAVIGKDGKLGKGKTPSLKKLSAEVLGLTIQADDQKGHSSAEDAAAAMALFKAEKAGFEREAVKTFGNAKITKKGSKAEDAIEIDQQRRAQSRSNNALDAPLLDSNEEDDDIDQDLEDDNEDDDENTNNDNGRKDKAHRPQMKQKRKGKKKKRTKLA